MMLVLLSSGYAILVVQTIMQVQLIHMEIKKILKTDIVPSNTGPLGVIAADIERHKFGSPPWKITRSCG